MSCHETLVLMQSCPVSCILCHVCSCVLQQQAPSFKARCKEKDEESNNKNNNYHCHKNEKDVEGGIAGIGIGLVQGRVLGEEEREQEAKEAKDGEEASTRYVDDDMQGRGT